MFFKFFKPRKTECIDIKELDSISDIDVIDIREQAEYEQGHIEGSRNIPIRKLLLEPMRYLNQSGKSFIICQNGENSTRVVQILNKEGFDVGSVSQGMDAYGKENLALAD